MSELSTLFPKHETVLIGKTKVKVYPVKLKDLETYSKATAELIALLADATAIKLAVYGAKNTGSLQELLKTCTNLSRRQIKNLDFNDALALGYQIVRVNYDFFAQALPEIIDSLPVGAGLHSD